MTRFLPSLILTALLLAGWEVACRALDVPVYLLPPPSAVAVALIERAPVLLSSAAATFWMAFQALIVAFILGGDPEAFENEGQGGRQAQANQPLDGRGAVQVEQPLEIGIGRLQAGQHARE